MPEAGPKRSRGASAAGILGCKIGDEALLIIVAMVSDSTLRKLGITCKYLSLQHTEGISRHQLLAYRTSVLDGVTALVMASALRVFADAEKRMLNRAELLGMLLPEDATAGDTFAKFYQLLSADDRRELFDKFMQGVKPAEEGLVALERYSKKDMGGPTIHLGAKGRYPSSFCVGGPTSTTPWMSGVVGGLRGILRNGHSFEGFLKGLFSYVRPEMPTPGTTWGARPSGRPTWTESLAICNGGGTCCVETYANTVVLVYDGLALSRALDEDHFIGCMFEYMEDCHEVFGGATIYGQGPALACWYGIYTPGTKKKFRGGRHPYKRRSSLIPPAPLIGHAPIMPPFLPFN